MHRLLIEFSYASTSHVMGMCFKLGELSLRLDSRLQAKRLTSRPYSEGCIHQPSMGYMPKRTIIVALAVLSVFGIYHHLSERTSTPRCHPYNQAGTLRFDRNHPEQTRWTSFDPTCQANNSLVEAFERGVPLPWIDGKQIMLVGDSVDRELLRWLCKLPGGEIKASELDDPAPVHDDATANKGLPRVCTFPSRGGLTIRNYHFCGLDYEGVWKDKTEPCIAPSIFPSRWKDFEQFVAKFPKPVDYATLNTGLWDLARYQRSQYMAKGRDDGVGLDDEFVAEWPVLAQEFINLNKGLLPANIPISWRTVHNVRSKAGHWFQPPHSNGKLPSSPPFTELRIHQIRELQNDLIRRNEIDRIPYGEVTNGQDVVYYLLDDIHPNEVGFRLMAEMFLDAAKRNME